MKDTVLATYKRESTLWKNANAFYKSQDWVLMECLFRDCSEDRRDDIRIMVDGKDVTEEFYADKFVIRLTNKSGKNYREYSYKTKDEANAKFKEIMNHRVLKNFKKM